MKPEYCTHHTIINCTECSLTNYGKDCMNNPVQYPHEITAKGYESVEKTVKPTSSGSASIYLPKDWAGHRVLCIRLD